jgi:hypothetical protein
VGRQVEWHACEILSQQGKGSAVRCRSGIQSEPSPGEGVEEDEGKMSELDHPTPGLPDDTAISDVELPALCVPKTLNPTIVVMKSAQDGT